MISQDYNQSDSEDPNTIKEFDQILKLAKLSNIQQVLTAIKLAYFPFTGFVMKNPDDEGLELVNEYGHLFKKITAYMQKKQKE